MRRQFVILHVILILFFFTADAQENKVDSLIREIQNREDTARVNILNEIGDLIYRSDPDEAIRYGKESKLLAIELDFLKGLAYANKNIGLGYFILSNYVEASLYWEESLHNFEELGDEEGIANIISNLAGAYLYMGDDAKAVDYYLKSLKMSEAIGDSIRIATCLLNIGSIYAWKPETVNKSLPYYLRALSISESINYINGIGMISFNLGDFFLQKESYDSSLLYFERSLEVYKNSIDVAPSLSNIGKIHAIRGDYTTAIEYQEEALKIAIEMDGKLEMAQVYLALAEIYQQQGNSKMAINYFTMAKDISEEIESNYDLKDAYEGLAGIFAEQADYRNAYAFQTLLNETDKTIYSIETDDKIKNLQFTYQIDKKQDEIEILEQQAEIEQLTNKRQRAIIAGIGFAGVLLLLLAILLYNRFKFAQRARKAIQKEKDRSENLLLNILPSKTAEELKETGKAKARKYESVTILFTDFKGFTSVAAGLDPEDLVDEINECYVKFDEIITKHGIEKIKTIGDAYMAAGGLPVKNDSHGMDIVKAAIEIRDYMLQLKANREKENRLFFEIRIGIHSGPVVAGIVGTKKFAYDIWGDTVNIAARMESGSEPGKVNISETTYQIIKDEYECDYRGEIECKNRGKMKMYFVNQPVKVESQFYV